MAGAFVLALDLLPGKLAALLPPDIPISTVMDAGTLACVQCTALASLEAQRDDSK